MAEDLKCSFCEDLFIGSKTIFCKQCMKESLQVLIEKDKEAHNDVCCPLCSAQMTQKDVESIPNNFLGKVKRLIRILSERGEDHDAASDTTSSSSEDDDSAAGIVLTGCGKCEGDVPAVSWCVKCQDSLCPSCDEVHGKWKNYREHETITIEEFEHRRGLGRLEHLQSTLKQSPTAYGQLEYCKTHTKQTLDLYCKTCSSLICRDCALKVHRHHKFAAVDEANKAESNYTSKKSSTQNQEVVSKDNHTSRGTATSKKGQAVVNGVTKSSQKEKHKKGTTDYKKELQHPLWVAKWDYSSTESNYLSFGKGDLLYIINTDMGDWWYARSKHTGQKGYIPCNFIEQLQSLDANDWYFGATTRKDAEKQLMQPFNVYGSFLIRNSDTSPGNYTLAIRDTKKIKHYKIHKLDGGGFYVTPQVTFEDIPKLVDYYSKQADILCVKLKAPCLHNKPSSAANVLNQVSEVFEVERSSITLNKKLWTGEFSEVWQGVWNNKTPVAVKTPVEGNVSGLHKEAEFMKQLKHTSIIQLYAVCTQEEPIYIITELMKHGRLLDYLRGDGHSLKLPQLMDIGAQIASAVIYLQEKKCVHRDLATRNVSVSENLVCKLADFGLARVNNVDTYQVPGGDLRISLRWTPPEIFLYNLVTIKSDVWSFGIFLYELITHGSTPYSTMSNTEAVQAVCTGYRMPCPTGCPDHLYEIMRECWMEDAAIRPTFVTLQSKLKRLTS